MKKSILNVALLSMLFVLGACSVKDSNATPSSPSIADAQTQLGDLSGFTRYHRDDAGVEGGYKDATSANVYFNGTDKLSIASAVARTGEWTKNGQIVSGENVITYQSAETYTVEVTNVTKYGESASQLKDIPTGWKVYERTKTMGKIWNSDIKWTEKATGSTDYYMLKVEGDELIEMRLDNITIDNGTPYANLFTDGADLSDLPRTAKFTKASI